MRLDEVREAALEDLFDAELALGHHHEVVGGLEALVTNGPLRERRWGQLLLALYRDGRQAEALPGASAGVAAAQAGSGPLVRTGSPCSVTLIFVTDALFALPRLAEIYDLVEEERNDLDHYLAIAAEFGARSVLDVGCGTGTFACLLADRGVEVAGVDPAAASLDVARAKPGAQVVCMPEGQRLSLCCATATGSAVGTSPAG